MKVCKKVCSVALSSLMMCQNGVFAATNNSIKVEKKKPSFKTIAKYTAGGVLGLTGIGSLIWLFKNIIFKNGTSKNKPQRSVRDVNLDVSNQSEQDISTSICSTEIYNVEPINMKPVNTETINTETVNVEPHKHENLYDVNTSDQSDDSILDNYDISEWKDRYNDIPDKNRELSYKDYRKFYVSQASDGRHLHDCILNESNTNTQKLDKKFITSVMERRIAHLQQAKFFIDEFIRNLNNKELLKSVVNKLLNKYNLEMNDLEDENSDSYKACEIAGFLVDDVKKYCKNEIEKLEKFLPNPELDLSNLVELSNLIDNLINILIAKPEKIPNLKLSDKSINKFNDVFEDENHGYESERDPFFVLGIKRYSKKYEPFMITSDEQTDRILSVFENYAYDGGNGHKLLEKLCGYVVLPNDLANDSVRGIAHELAYSGKIPTSKNFSNPYRGKYGVYIK